MPVVMAARYLSWYQAIIEALEEHLKKSFGELLALMAERPFLAQLADINRGVEREALRVTPHGRLAMTPHPGHLGSKLCHPSITTDFSEAQLELITPVTHDIGRMLDVLDEIHRYVYSGLEEESLWAASMPCELPEDTGIPLACYGRSNLGRLKTTYRNGLGYRYGRTMQTICAVHYNFSLPDALWEMLWGETGRQEEPMPEFRSRRYFDVMRNFRRFSWLPVYLFGASPAVAESFVRNRPHALQRLDANTLYSPAATSLRNGDLGYQSTTQSAAIQICYNSLENYVDTLVDAVLTPLPQYARIGVKSDEDYLQINDSMLQSEAEFYTTIRAKCIPQPGRNFLRKLQQGGVEYVEVRLLDVNPYLPLGIDAEQIRFLDTMLMYCFLLDSPLHDEALCRSVQENVLEVVYRGRDRDLKLNDQGRRVTVQEWGVRLLDDMQAVARLLDQADGSGEHQLSLARQMERIRDPETTLSAAVLQDMGTNSQSFLEFALEKTMEHRSNFLSRPLPAQSMEAYRLQAERSLEDQYRLEQADKVTFDAYLERIRQGYHELAAGRQPGQITESSQSFNS